MTANGEWMSSDGHYPFTLRYGNDADVQVSKEKRRNTDVENLRAEISAFANLSDKEQWRLKAYYYQSSRGLPNATTLYYDFSRQNLRIRTPLSKASTRKSLAENGYSRPLPSGTGVIRTIRTRMLLPPSEELTTAITSKNITCPLPLYTGYGTTFLSPCPPTEASIR